MLGLCDRRRCRPLLNTADSLRSVVPLGDTDILGSVRFERCLVKLTGPPLVGVRVRRRWCTHCSLRYISTLNSVHHQYLPTLSVGGCDKGDAGGCVATRQHSSLLSRRRMPGPYITLLRYRPVHFPCRSTVPFPVNNARHPPQRFTHHGTNVVIAKFPPCRTPGMCVFCVLLFHVVVSAVPHPVDC